MQNQFPDNITPIGYVKGTKKPIEGSIKVPNFTENKNNESNSEMVNNQWLNEYTKKLAQIQQ